MGQASISVDIQAKIKGWQEEFAKLKSAASKVDLGSSFGKSLLTALNSLEKQINHMAQNMTLKLTSDSGIDSFITKLGNIDTQFLDLGTRISGISFDLLDPSYVTAGLKELNELLAEALAALDLKTGEGFHEAVMQSQELRSALEKLGENPATVTIQLAGEILARGIDTMKTKVTEATGELERLLGELSGVKKQAESLANEPIAGLTDLGAKAREIAGELSDYGFKAVDATGLNQWIASIRSSLIAAGLDLSDESNAINLAFTQLAGSKTRQEVEDNLRNLKLAISNAKIKGISLADLGLGNIQTLANKFIHDDLAALDNAKTALLSKLLELKIPQEVTDQIVFDFTKLVKEGNWEQAITLLEQRLNAYKLTIADKTAEIKAQEESLSGQISVTKSVRRNAILTQTTAEKALSNDYQLIVKDLQSKNLDLEARVKELESLINNKKSELTSAVQKTGGGVTQESARQFLENAAAAKLYKDELEQVQAREQLIGKVQGVVQRWFSIYAVVRMVSNAVKSVISTIKELDATITEIAIVTKMDQSDLWNQMDQYTALARKYAASISGVYKVSQLYYQQGLGQSDVMALTEQTLKMARISGLDYAEATDYMTNAVRSFKMEMTEALRVVDVYSAVAASSATNVTELATAMSKTASSANAVGSSFENTTAMMAVMIEATRESAENIGSALKSIISRYGELKENKTGIDSEGEEYSLNKVDKALLSVGLSIHDANGEFRDFDDVIMELAEKWDTIDKNTQRYIATVMAGNRQQSRFLALVSSYDRLQELSAEAADSADAAQLQFLKTLDSVDAKTQQLQTSLQSLYVDSGLEEMYKGILDIARNIISSFADMPKMFNLPIPAIAKFGLAFASLANVVTTVFGLIKAKVSANVKAILGEVSSGVANTTSESNASYQLDVANYAAAARQKVEIEQLAQNQIKAIREGNAVDPSTIGVTGTGLGTKVKGGVTRGLALAGVGMSMGGLVISGIADNMQALDQNSRNWKGGLTAVGSTLQGAGLGMSIGGPWGAAVGGVVGLAVGALQALDIINEDIDEKISRVNADIESTNNERIKAKDDLKTLTEYKKKYDEALKNRYLDSEHEQEWIDLNNEIVSTYPELLGYIDAEGNAIANLGTAYDNLAGKKRDAYALSLLKNIQANLTSLSDMLIQMKDMVDGYESIYLSKDRLSGHWGNLAWLNYIPDSAYEALGLNPKTFKLLPTAGEGNKAVDDVLLKILQAATDSHGNYELFLEKVLEYTNATWDELMYLGYSTTNLAGDELITDDMNKALKNICRHIDELFSEYFNLIDTYLTGEFSNLVSFYGEDMDFSQYSFLGDQFTKDLLNSWNNFIQLPEISKLDPAELMKQFWAQIPGIIQDANDAIFVANTPDPKKLEKAEAFYTHQGDYSYDLIMNLSDTLGEEIADLFSPEQITEILNNVAEKLRKSFLAVSNTIEAAIEDNKVENSDALQLLPYTLRTIMQDMPQLFLDSYVAQFLSILTSGSFSKAGRETAALELTNMLTQIGLSNADLATKNKAYGILASADMTSLLSIRETESKLRDLGFDVDFSEIVDVLLPNIRTELQMYSDNLVDSFTSLSEALDKANKGLDLKDAVKMAEELGLTLEDFELIGDKFYIRNFAALEKQYSKKNAQFEADMQGVIDDKKLDYSWLDNTWLVHQDTKLHNFDWNTYMALESEEERRAYYESFGQEAWDAFEAAHTSTHVTGMEEYATPEYEAAHNEARSYWEGITGKSFNRSDNWQYDKVYKQWMQDNPEKSEADWEEFVKLATYATNMTKNTYGTTTWYGEVGSVPDVFEFLEEQRRRSQNGEDIDVGPSAFYESDGSLILSYSEVLSETNFELNGMVDMFGGNMDAITGYIEMFRTELEESGINVDELLVEMQRYIDNGDFSIPFTDWLFEDLEREAKEVREATEKATQYKLGSTALKAGKINDFMRITLGTIDEATEKFLQKLIDENGGTEQLGMRLQAEQMATAQREKVINAIKTGNVEELWADADLAEWADDIYELYGEVSKTVYESVTSGFKSGKYITSTDVTDYKFKELMDAGLVEQVGEHLYKVVGSYNDLVYQIMNDETLDEDTKAAQLKSLFEENYKDMISPISNVLKLGGASYDEAVAFAEAMGYNASEVSTCMDDYGFHLNQLTGKYEAGAESIALIRAKINELEKDPDADLEELNKLRAMVDNYETQEKRKNIYDAYTEVFENYDKVSTDAAAALATALGMNYDTLIATYFTDNGNGTFSLDMSKAQSLIKQGREALGDQLYNDLLNSIAEFYDEGLESASSALEYVSKGTTSITDMLKFVSDYNKKLGSNYTMTEMFSWDDILDAWTLDPKYLSQYLDAQRATLKEAGLNDEQIEEYINQQIDEIKKAVDISGFLTSENRKVGSKARKTLETSMRAALSVDVTFASENWEDYLEDTSQMNEYGKSLAEKSAREAAAKAVLHNMELTDAIDAQIEQDIALVEAGGLTAIAVMRQYSEDGELTVEQVEAAYKARLKNITTVMDALEGLQENTIVDATTRDILNAIPGFQVSADGIVQSVGDLTTAYEALYNQMKSTMVATTSELNAAYAKLLNQKANEDIDAIEALNNAMGMTYDALGTMLSEYNKSLEEIMSNPSKYGLTDIGGGKIQISDFSKFAAEMGWDQNSEEYISAYKQYNDSLIDYNKHIADEIKGEFDALSQAKGGDQVNVTRMVAEYGEDKINEVLKDYSYILKDGILTITDAADAPQIAAALGQLAYDNGAMVGAEAEAVIALVTTKAKADLDSAYTAMLSDTNAVTVEAIKNLALATGRTYASIASEFTSNDNGTYKMDTADILNILAEAKGKVSTATYNSLLVTLRGTLDEILKTITSGIDYVNGGTSSLTDMQKFINSYNEIVSGEDIKIEDAFSYDTNLDTFVLSGSVLKKYIEALKTQLEELGITGDALNQYIEDQTTKILQSKMDITSILDDSDRTAQKKSIDSLYSTVKDYLDLGNQVYRYSEELMAEIKQEIADLYEKDASATSMEEASSYYHQAEELLASLKELTAEQIVAILYQGGEAAVEVLKQVKGEEVTSEEIQAVYYAGINRIKKAQESLEGGVGTVLNGVAATIALASSGIETEELPDGSVVITAVHSMVDAYIQLYARMKMQAETTTSDLNAAYARILTAQDQQNVDVLDALQNASGMTYDALATMVSTYSDKLLEDVMDSASLQRTGFGTVRIIDWNAFMAEIFGDDFMNDPRFQALSQTPEYAEAYSSWVDSMVELLNYPQTIAQNTADQINSLLEAKPGQAVNVAYLERALGPEKFQEILNNYGVEVENGILRIPKDLKITDIVSDIAQAAAEAGAIIPEQLAEIVDAVQEVLALIASLIGNGIDGSLSNADAQKLTSWANDNGLNIYFTLTAEGLKLTNESAAELYAKMNEMDAILGLIVFDKLKDSLIESDDRFKSMTSQAAYMKKLEKDITYEQNKKKITENNGRVAMFDEMNGNVDLYNRPRVQNDDGTYSTLLTSTLDSRNFETEIPWVMNVTPITKDGQVLDEAFLSEYIQGLIDGTDGSLEAILEADAKDLGLIIELADAAGKDQDSLAESYGQRGELLHEISEAYEAIKDGETYDDTKIQQYEKELELCNEIKAARATSEDDSFNFMSNDIPAAQNNPLNYWNNWATAFDAINNSMESGHMGYQDFYNIVTEMGNLAELSGLAITIGESVLSNSLDAADLITRAAGALENVDGKMQVNLGNIGIDFSSGVDSMAEGVDAGIHELAQSQIDILDGLIALMEVIVAMEGLSDIDVEGDGIDIGDIMTVHYDGEGKMTGADYTAAYDAWRKDMVAKFKDYIEKGGATGTSEYIDLGKAMEGIKFHYEGGSKSFADILQMDATELAGMSEDFLKAYAAFLDGMVQAALSGDYDLDNIYESIKTVLANSGIDNLTIDMGDKTFHIGGGTIAVIDWNNEDAINAATEALNEWERNNTDYFANLGNNATIKDKIAAITDRLALPDLDIEERVELEYILGLATGEIYIKEITEGENKGKYTGNYKGHSFTAVDEKTAESIIKLACETEAAGFNVKISSTGEVSGTMKVGAATIVLTYDAKGKETYTTIDNQTFTSKDDAIAHCVSMGYGDSGMAGQRYTIDGETFEVQYNSSLGLTYAINLATGKITYKGREFSSKEALIDFVKNVEPLMKSLKMEVTDDGAESGLEIISNDTATITRNIETGKIKYEADGFPFNNAQDLGSYLFAKKMAEDLAGKGGKITIDPGQLTTTLEYAYGGGHVTLTVNSTGDMSYHCDIDGASIDATTEEGLKAGLAAHAALAQLEGGELSQTEGGSTGGLALFTYKGKNMTIQVDSTGAVISGGDGLTEDLKTAIKNSVESSTAADPITANATVGEITADASGATTTITPDPLTATEPIDKVTATATTLEVLALNVVIAGDTDGGDTGNQNTESTNTVTTEFKTTGEEEATAAAEAVQEAANATDETDPSVEVDTPGADEAEEALDDVSDAAYGIPTNRNTKITAQDSASTILKSIQDTITTLTSTTYKIKFKAEKTGTWPSSSTGLARGNVGRALASGGTLMGELGPEMVVQNGHYFVAGQQGAEFVNLSPDAIVFNHLQTEQLLKKGMSKERGRAVTNERVAAAYAHGNINGGEAMASASAALAALKQLRAMWQSLLKSSVKDLAGAGGGGGGGGGGANGDEYGNFMKELEKWYNWLQKIAELEEEINYQETLRSKIQSDMIPHGQDITKSYLTSLNALEDEVAVLRDLMNAQLDYFDSRREWMNSEKNPFSALYTFDENGQIKYADGKLEEFSLMIGSNEYGAANMTAKEQYDKLAEMGYADYMKYDSEGKEIDFYKKKDDGTYELDENGNKIEDKTAYETAVQAFWDKIDADKEEMQSLHDSINEHRDAILEKLLAMNEIMKAIEDNLISVENRVLKAVEDLHLREIDDAKDQRDAIEEASNHLIDGLSDQLLKERDMYANQQASDELAKLLRQLAIALRSGASASLVASLQSLISDKMQDAYFDAQQEQIDALQEAADAQLEKLDAQIDLMEEQLAYQKEHGMLWSEVYTVMQGSPEEIANYIKENDSSLWGNSPTKTAQEYRDMLYEAQLFTEFRDNVEGGLDALVQKFTDTSGDSEGAAGSNHSDDGSGGGGNNDTGGGNEGGNNSTKNYKAVLHARSAAGENVGLGQFTATAASAEAAALAILSQANAKITSMNQKRSDNKKLLPLSMSEIQGSIQAYKKGGLITETGYIKVHGTEEEPEGILSGEDTNSLQQFWDKLNSDYDMMQELHDSIQKHQSEISLQLELASAIAINAQTDTMFGNEQIVIEHAEVNMNIEKIADDYDAERAGEKALEKMLSIARKSKGWNRVGR